MSKILDRLKISADLSRFDSCGWPKNFDYRYKDFIYPAVAGRRIVNLFKVLQTNYCQNNCLYCVNRRNRECKRFRFSPQELASIFMSYYKRRLVEGFFLSSSIYKSADFSQEEMLSTVKILRGRFGYRGYIHFVILPEVSFGLIKEVKKFVDRLSINLEVPYKNYLSKISLEKDFDKILKTLKFISDLDRERPLKAGVSTQFIVGTVNEKDREILETAFKLYKDFKLARVFYSGFSPVLNTPLEKNLPCSGLRELRLYQADILFRKYGFSLEDLVFDQNGNLSLESDPKISWAKRNPEFFPIEVNKADFKVLLKIPGVGKISAERITKLRQNKKIKDLTELKRLGVIVKRAKDFITLDGKSFKEKFSPKKKIESFKEQERQLFIWEEL